MTESDISDSSFQDESLADEQNQPLQNKAPSNENNDQDIASGHESSTTVTGNDVCSSL